MKRVLMVAFHFPPMTGSSGIQRTLRFARDLLPLGWQPIVLSAHPRVYMQTGTDQLREVPEGAIVERAFAVDTARHLALFGRYPSLLARPDRWVSWWLGAVPAGMRLIRKYRPQAIWSTYPIATAHMIGASLSRAAELPWIADFRDPMAQEGYPPDPRVWKSFQSVEEKALRNAAFSVFTCPGPVRFYLDRYPDLDRQRLKVIENGYDEETFTDAESATDRTQVLNPGRITLLHSGIVYPSERDPTALFEALQRLIDSGRVARDTFRLRFRAPTHFDLLEGLRRKHGLGDVVEILPPIPYREALGEMLRADGLLVMQSGNCNDQVPAKIYEYLRARRPLLALTDPVGDTASLMRRAQLNTLARLDSVEDIARALPDFIDRLRNGGASLPAEDIVRGSSRQSRATELQALLETVSR